jgi:8-hydroxy-5-deazaflavin:NADPH oxidoreductase
MSPDQRSTIGVLGSGPVGRGFATLLEHAGYDVTLGTRRANAPELADLPARVGISGFRNAARCDVIFLAVVHLASRDLVTSLMDDLAGKILIDADNAWITAHYRAAGLSAALTEGSWLGQLLPDTTVARAFSHINAPYLVPRGLEEPGTWAVSYAVDDPDAASTIEQLIRDMGYIPYPVGTLEQSAVLDFGGALSGQLLTPDQMRDALNAHNVTTQPPFRMTRGARR